VTETQEEEASLHLTFTAQTQVTTWKEALQNIIHDGLLKEQNRKALPFRSFFGPQAPMVENGFNRREETSIGRDAWASKTTAMKEGLGLGRHVNLKYAMTLLGNAQSVSFTAGTAAPTKDMIYLMEPALFHPNSTITASPTCDAPCQVCTRETKICRECSNVKLAQWTYKAVQTSASPLQLRLLLQNAHREGQLGGIGGDRVGVIAAVHELTRVGCLHARYADSLLQL